MERTGCKLALVENEVLGSDTRESTSGYDSGDSACSLGFDFPAAKYSGPSQVMIFKSTRDLQDSLAFILNMPELCDVTFLVGKEDVPVHGVKAILATRSRSLYQLVLDHQRRAEMEPSKKRYKKQKQTPLSNTLVIKVEDYQVDDFRRFIAFVHSGKVKVDIFNAVGLLCAAVEFGLQGLHTACMDFIRRCHSHGQTEHIMTSIRQYAHKKAARKLMFELS